ncbi:hypothetical protein BC830DRAFT_1100597 [Chytriomyces sp. MP71]|nr:hypothetical protein BC830DRAFT_1100597 [Chytriomyces sp. MP71]
MSEFFFFEVDSQGASGRRRGMVLTNWTSSVIGVATIAIASLASCGALSYGIQLLIRGHNTSKSMGRFKRRRRAVAAAIRELEDELRIRLDPRLASVGVAVAELLASSTSSSTLGSGSGFNAPHATTVSTIAPPASPASAKSLLRQVRELDELLIRALERLDAVKPADAADGVLAPDALVVPETSIPDADASSISASTIVSDAESSDSEASDATRHSASFLVTDTASASTLTSSKRSASVASNESSATLVDVHPPVSMAVELPLSHVTQKSAALATTAAPSTTSSLVSYFLPAATATSSFMDAYPTTLFFNTDELPKQAVEHIQTSILQLRLRKRAVVKRVQKLAAGVDLLFDKLAAAGIQ